MRLSGITSDISPWPLPRDPPVPFLTQRMGVLESFGEEAQRLETDIAGEAPQQLPASAAGGGGGLWVTGMHPALARHRPPSLLMHGGPVEGSGYAPPPAPLGGIGSSSLAAPPAADAWLGSTYALVADAAALAPLQWACGSSMTPGSSTSGDALQATLGASPACGDSGDSRGRTTVMMRNIPKVLTQAQVLQLLDAEGFRGAFDFFYLPTDFVTGANVGFAFVNLTTAAAAKQFRAHFHRFSKWGVRTAKLCNVSWARDEQQGLAANVRRYRNSSVMHSSVPEEHRPILLVGGVPVRFPRPSKRLWTPHTNCGAHGEGAQK